MTSPGARADQAPDELTVVRDAIATLAHLPGALLPMLHAVQDRLGHVPEAAVPLLAEALNLSRAEVHGVLSYYHHFRSKPPGRHIVQVCRAEACQARGAEALWAQACERLGCADDRHGSTRADGAVTLLPVYCLGLCASSPAMAVDERVHGRVSAERFERLVASLPGLEG